MKRVIKMELTKFINNQKKKVKDLKINTDNIYICKQNKLYLDALKEVNAFFHIIDEERLSNLIIKNDHLLRINKFDHNNYYDLMSDCKKNFYSLEKIRKDYIINENNFSSSDLEHKKKQQADNIGKSYEQLSFAYAQNLYCFMKNNNDRCVNQFNKDFLTYELESNYINKIDFQYLLRYISENNEVLNVYNNRLMKKYNLKSIKLWNSNLKVYPNKSININEAFKLLKSFLSVYIDDKLITKILGDKWIVINNNIPFTFEINNLCSHPIIFCKWSNNFSDLINLTHEIGHAFHNYINKKNNKFQKHSIDIMSAETISIYFEYIFLNWIKNIRGYKDIANDYLFNRFKTSIFNQARFSDFEFNLYEKISKKGYLNKNIIDSEYKRSLKKYDGEKIANYKYVSAGWARLPHLFVGMYTYKYIYGSLLAYYFVYNSNFNKVKEFIKSPNNLVFFQKIRDLNIDFNYVKIMNSLLDSMKNINKTNVKKQ